MRRRQFIGAAAASLLGAAVVDSRAARRGPRLRILILGGTQFIGVHMTSLALKRGHQVTLFNRGRTHAELFPQVEKLRGDRDGQLDALRGHSWDAVIDDSGYLPRHVRLSAQLLAPHVQRYVFVSTISVYASFAQPPDEDSPLATLSDERVESLGYDTYGGRKALCERAAEMAMPHRCMVLRPGVIVGPDDPTDRFTYWPARAARGGELLAPAPPSTATQYIDARDLARFVLDGIERELTGTFNLVTPPGHFTMGDLVASSIDSARRLAKPSPPPKAVWVSSAFLERQQIEPGPQMPMWFPASGADAGFGQVSAARALAAGLRVRPISETVRDTLAWHLTRPPAERDHLKSGLASAREAQLLTAWRASSPDAHPV